MKYLYLIASCYITGLAARLTDGYSERSASVYSPRIEPRDPSDQKQSGVLEIRAHNPVKSSTALQKGQAKDPARQSANSPLRGSTKASDTNYKVHREPSPSRKQQKDNPTAQAISTQSSNAQESTPRPRISLLNTKLGVTGNPFPAPFNRSFLRRKARLTENKRPQIRYTRPGDIDGVEAGGFALVRGPATVQKTAGEHGIQLSSDVKANEQAIVRVRHKTAVSIGGVAQPGGSITAMMRGDHVGAWIDAQVGGRGYIRDESDKKIFKGVGGQTTDVPPGTELRQTFTGSPLIPGSLATTKAQIEGPGVISMAAMRFQPRADVFK